MRSHESLLLRRGWKPGTRLSISVGLTLPGGWTQTATVADWRANRVALPDRIPAVFALLA